MGAIQNALTGKSRTINANGVAAIVVPMIVMGARRYGIELTPEEATVLASGVFALMNWILRFMTTTALGDK